MIELQPNEWMMIAAMCGAIIHMVLGYLNKKQHDPDMKFEYPYLTTTIVTILAMGLLFENVEVAKLTLGGILFALLSGMGGNSAISKKKIMKG